ncbi:serine hydrolase [Paludibaculum fermentans]|uniref:beta-lactamase n=1 Tax=Paludibaculum fermentans TaxID=1473598 RepID=A0A7S7SKX1_PALFE|nr:serine hydrolase [Paludibaculum fermentans]QOY87490.1 serine hydrolase [Paludibaculum fermentans]
MKLLAACYLLCLTVAAQTEPPALLEKKTLSKLETIDAAFDGVLGVTAIDLKSGRTFSLHGDLLTTQASLIKIPILVTAFHAIQAGALSLDRKYTMTSKDAVGGSGTLDARLAQGPVELTLMDLLTLMIRDSDNTATNRVISLVTIQRVNALMLQLGLPNTRLRRIMMDAESARKDAENTSTPLEMARLVELIYRNKVATPAACAQMVDLLKLVKADFRAALPSSVAIASKVGEVPGVHTEAGIVYLEGRPYILSVMASLAAGAANPIRDVAEVVHAHFVRLANSNRYGHRVSDPLF